MIFGESLNLDICFQILLVCFDWLCANVSFFPRHPSYSLSLRKSSSEFDRIASTINGWMEKTTFHSLSASTRLSRIVLGKHKAELIIT
jgi:hypothetical protein